MRLVRWEEARSGFSIEKRGDKGRSERWSCGGGRRGEIEWLREDYRGILTVHVVTGGWLLVSH